MKLRGNQIKVGNILLHKDGLWKVTKTEHVKPGKGGAHAQVELKNLKTDTKDNARFRADESVERATLEEDSYQYLYQEGDLFHFMKSTEDFSQVALQKDFIGPGHRFLVDGMEVMVRFFEDTPVDCKLPATVTATVVTTDPVVTGQTATASFKSSVLDNGLTLLVPPHIEEGSRVVINTETLTYLEKARGK